MTLRESLLRFVNEATCPVSDSCLPGFVSGAYWGWGEARNQIGRLLKKFPEEKKSIPDDAICLFPDGNAFAAVRGNFINLQESPSGFGDDYDMAIDSLLKDEKRQRAGYSKSV